MIILVDFLLCFLTSLFRSKQVNIPLFLIFYTWYIKFIKFGGLFFFFNLTITVYRYTVSGGDLFVAPVTEIGRNKYLGHKPNLMHSTK